jgi:hypothetical protein
MSRALHRRQALRSLLAGAATLALPAALRAQGPTILVEVWKSPTCGCCQDWIRHIEGHGFRAKVHDVGNTAARARLKVPIKLGSCHTAWVGGYAIEGHVPVADIQRLLRERPDAIGLAVPGMPIGSPGMDGPEYGDRRDPYDVLLIARDGSTRVFSSHFKAGSQTGARS